MQPDITAEQIDDLLPQTQCGDCGYKGCRPYAEAIAQGRDSIDHCPPGGVPTLKSLASLLNIDPEPYIDAVAASTRTPSLAIIREPECIGCTKCIQACPVDAIIGSAKQMHTIIADECTGCGLCVEPCPVDCIDLIDIDEAQFDKDKSRDRFAQRQRRLQRLEQAKIEKQRKATYLTDTKSTIEERTAKQSYIQEAIARAKAKKNNPKD